MEEEHLEEVIEEPLGDDDIRHYLPNAKILKYSELQHYPTLDDLLPNSKDFAIILYEESPNKGHWICVSKYEPIVEFFDPYGIYPDNQLGWINCDLRKKLRQTKTLLTDLFNKSDYEVVYNPVKYQATNNDINTCGRHCVFRIVNLIKGDKDLHNYYNLMKYLKDSTGLTYDEIVANYIDKI